MIVKKVWKGKLAKIITRTQENILRYSKMINSTEEIAKQTKLTTPQVEMAIFNLSRKGYITPERTKVLLQGSKLLNKINISFGAKRVVK